VHPRIALRSSDPATCLEMAKAFEGAPIDWDVFFWSDGCESHVVVGDDDACSVPFDVSDPARAIESVAALLVRGRKRITVLTGARRGTGVSTLALHLAVALGETAAVCVVDLDPDSSLRARLGLPEDARDWAPSEDDVLSAAIPCSGGFRLLLAPRAPFGDVRPLLDAAVERYQHVVVDAPPSPCRAVVLASSTQALLLVPPSRQGIAHAHRTIAAHPETDWSCVVNRMGAGGELTVRQIGNELQRPISVELPCSPYLRDREDDHRLLDARWSRYYRRVTRLAGALS
jgi:hypothetical protein